MHPIKRNIISKLVYTKELRYSELKGTELESDQFWFHLKNLLKENLVAKENNKYVLTEQGKLSSHEFDLTNLQKIEFPLTVVAVVAKHKNDYLLLERTRHPFQGYFSFPGGKVYAGETLEQAASRIFHRKTNIKKEQFKLLGIQHEMNIDDKEKVIRDAYVHLMETSLTAEETKDLEHTREGKLLLIPKEKALKQKPHFREIETVLAKNNSSNFFFEEYKTTQKP